jgi:hypothetical protein
VSRTKKGEKGVENIEMKTKFIYIYPNGKNSPQTPC